MATPEEMQLKAQRAHSDKMKKSVMGRLASGVQKMWDDAMSTPEERRVNLLVDQSVANIGEQIKNYQGRRVADSGASMRPDSRSTGGAVSDFVSQNPTQASRNLASVREQSASVPPAPQQTQQVPPHNTTPIQQPESNTQGGDPLMSELENAYKASVAQRQGNINAQQNMADALSQTYQPQLDLSPLLAYADSETGSNLMKGYKRAETPQQRMQMIQAIQNGITQEKRGISQDHIALIKAKLAKQKESFQNTDKRMYRQRQKDEAAFSKIWDQADARGKGTKYLRGIRERTDLARNGLRILDNTVAAGGDIRMTEQLSFELAMAIGKMMSGGQPAITMVEHMVPKSVGGTTASIQQYIKGNPEKFLSKEFQNQFKHTLDAEEKFWGEQIKKERDSLAKKASFIFERNPDMQDLFIEQYSPDHYVGGKKEAQPSATVKKYSEAEKAEMRKELARRGKK